MRRLQLLIIALMMPGMLLAQSIAYPTHFTVAQDGSGNYKTIKEAINAVRDLSQQQVSIFIKKGTCHEKLVISSWKTKITLIGEGKDPTIITNSDFSGKANPKGRAAWSHQLTDVEVKKYTLKNILAGNDNWDVSAIK
jgi:pectinesterase